MRLNKAVAHHLKGTQRISQFLFMVYFFLLVWIILMKTEFSLSAIYPVRSLNLVPLAGTAIRNNQLDYQEIGLNILIFVPFGLYLSMLKEQWSFLQKLLPIFLVSFLFESLQYILVIGVSDITDLIANTIGGFLGLLFYGLVAWLLKDHQKAQRFFNYLGGFVSGSFFFLIILLLRANS